MRREKLKLNPEKMVCSIAKIKVDFEIEVKLVLEEATLPHNEQVSLNFFGFTFSCTLVTTSLSYYNATFVNCPEIIIGEKSSIKQPV